MSIRTSSLTSLLLLAVACSQSATAASDVAWPDTAPAKVAQAFIKAMSDGSDKALRGFDARYRSAEAAKKTPSADWVEKTRTLRKTMGTFEPVSIEQSTDSSIMVAAETSGGVAVHLEFTMSGKEPGKMLSVGIAVEPDAKQTTIPLTEASRAELVEGVAKAVEANYVFPDVGAKMAAKVRAQLASGAYASITNERAMASKLTTDLLSFNNDSRSTTIGTSACSSRRSDPSRTSTAMSRKATRPRVTTTRSGKSRCSTRTSATCGSTCSSTSRMRSGRPTPRWRFCGTSTRWSSTCATTAAAIPR
jgi:hypothetical protein